MLATHVSSLICFQIQLLTSHIPYLDGAVVTGKHETAKQYILDTYKEFESNMLNKGAIPLSVEGPLEQVVERIISEIE
jgi:hypothetical protein